MKINMKRKLFIISLLFLQWGISYEFPSDYLSFSTGYVNDSLHWSGENSLNDNDHAIDEKIEEINNLSLSARSRFQFSNHFLFFADFEYLIGKTSHAKADLTATASNYNQTIGYDFTQSFEKKADNDQYDLDLGFGYPFEMGPLQIAPRIGFYYLRQYLSKKDISYQTGSSTVSGITYQMSMTPDQKSLQQWYLPFIGIHLTLTPMAGKRLQYGCYYHFYYGRLRHRSRYLYDSTVTESSDTTTYSYNEKMIAKVSAYSHFLELNSYYGWLENFATGLRFTYQYYRGRNGTSDLHLTGVKAHTNPSVSSRVDTVYHKDFHKMRKQSFSLLADFRYQF